MALVMRRHAMFFFFNDTATTEIYTLSLHDALPIWIRRGRRCAAIWRAPPVLPRARKQDRKSTRLNSSHSQISYAVFCLKKKKKTHQKALSKITLQRDSCHYTRLIAYVANRMTAQAV